MKIWTVYSGDCECCGHISFHLTKAGAIAAAEKIAKAEDEERAKWEKNDRFERALTWLRIDETHWERNYDYMSIEELTIED